jgi:hypothetical protein
LNRVAPRVWSLLGMGTGKKEEDVLTFKFINF